MKMVAMKPLRYGGRNLVAGDEFDVVRDKDVKILTAIKKATPVGSLPLGIDEPEVMTPVGSLPLGVDEPLPEDDPVMEGVTPRRRYYRRRDLKAEGSD